MTGAVNQASVIIVAMEEEAAPFLERADRAGDPTATSANAVRRDLIVGGTPVVLLRAGIGFVNATAAAAYSHYRFGVDVPLISAGTAGGLAAGLEVGQVVVGSRCVNVGADATVFGYALGQVPGMPEDYAADGTLTARALTTGTGQTLRPGTIGSSESFVTAARAARLREDFPDVLAVDMESAAIAQFAHTHGRAFLSIRAVSDLCAPDGSEFLTHVDDAADRSADVVTAVIMGL